MNPMITLKAIHGTQTSYTNLKLSVFLIALTLNLLEWLWTGSHWQADCAADKQTEFPQCEE